MYAVTRVRDISERGWWLGGGCVFPRLPRQKKKNARQEKVKFSVIVRVRGEQKLNPKRWPVRGYGRRPSDWSLPRKPTAPGDTVAAPNHMPLIPGCSA